MTLGIADGQNGWTIRYDGYPVSLYRSIFSPASPALLPTVLLAVAYDNMQLVPGTRRSGYRTISHTATLLTVQN